MNLNNKKIESLKYLTKLSLLQDQMDTLESNQISEFYDKNSKIKFSSLISLTIGSLVARSDKMEIYADLLLYFYQHQDIQMRHSFRCYLLKYLIDVLDKYHSHNVLGFCVQLLERKLLFPKDIKRYHTLHFLVEYPEMIEKYAMIGMGFKLLEIPKDVEYPLDEIHKRRMFAYINLPIPTAIRFDDLDLFQKLINFVPEEETKNNFYQKISNKSKNLTQFDVSFNTLPWFDRNEMISLDPVTYIQYAAFYGSIKCFRFMVANGACIAEKQDSIVLTQNFAIAGGNLEIIRICQQKGLNFFKKECLSTAIRYHRPDLVEWIIFNMKNEQENNKNEQNGQNEQNEQNGQNEQNEQNGQSEQNGQNEQNEQNGQNEQMEQSNQHFKDVNDGQGDLSINENNDDDNLKKNYQMAINYCVEENSYSIMKMLFSNLGMEESTINSQNISEFFDIDDAFSYLPSTDDYCDFSGIDMQNILTQFLGEESKLKDKVIPSNDCFGNEEEDADNSFFYDTLKILSKLQIQLKKSTLNFSKEVFNIKYNFGLCLFALIEAGCKARPDFIETYASLVSGIFSSIKNIQKREKERIIFLKCIRQCLLWEPPPLNNESSTNNNESSTKSNENDNGSSENGRIRDECHILKYDYNNKNSLICLCLHLIMKNVINFSEIKDIKLMMQFFTEGNPNSEFMKRINGMRQNPIASAILDDNLEQLKALSSQITTENISKEEQSYDWSSFIASYQEVNWLDYSAFYRSKKCFSYLFDNFFNSPKYVKHCVNFALGGGNRDIVKKIDEGFEYDEVLPILIQSQVNSVIEQFISDYPSYFFKKVANYAFYFNNFKLILFLVDLNLMDKVDFNDIINFCGESSDFNYHFMIGFLSNYWNHGLDFIEKDEIDGGENQCNIW